MRVLLIGLLAATLAGCATVAHDDTSAARAPAASRVNKVVVKAKPAGLRIASRATDSREADPAIAKAKTAIAAMLEYPQSAQFYNLERAPKKLLDRTFDTICGYVKARTASGGSTREMRFLYTVDDGEAYLVNGTSQVAETVHGALCK